MMVALVDLPFPEAGLADAVSRRFRELGHQPLSWTGDVLVDDLSVLADSDLVIHGHPDRGGDLPDRPGPARHLIGCYD